MKISDIRRRKNQRPPRNISGQARPYFILMMLALVAAWATIINLAKLLQERMMMQNAADSAALAVAQYQARVLNVVSYLNNSMARALASGAFPALTPIALYNQQYVGHPGDARCKKPPTFLGLGFEVREESRSVAATAALVKACSEAQKNLIAMYPIVSQLMANEIAGRQQYDSDDDKTGAWMTIAVPLKISGLKKNDLKIKYYKTKVYEVSWPPGKHVCVFLPEEYRTDDVSWYYIDDKNDFDLNRKVTVAAIKPAPKGYPLFAGLLGLKIKNPWFVTATVASAAAYNPRGPSFPLEKNNSTGMSIQTLPIAMVQLNESLQKMAQLAREMGDIPFIGGPLAGVAATLAATVSAVATTSVVYAMTSDETPIKRYDESSNPENDLTGTELEYGWEAHLAPVGIPLAH